MAYRLASVRELSGLLVKGIHASDWYPAARESIRQWSEREGQDYARVCDVLALASPRKAVADSVRIAIHYLRTGKMIDVVSSVRKQWLHWESTGLINGPKCRAFAAALRGDDSALVVDTWIMQALRAPINSKGTRWVLGAAGRRFNRLSAITGLPVASAQAAVWAGVQGGKCAYLEMGGADARH